jgi:outer membrane protein assembly factor BamB
MREKVWRKACFVCVAWSLVALSAGQAPRQDVTAWAARLGLQPVWSLPLSRPDPRDSVLAAQLLDSDLLVVQMRSAVMLAVDAQTGLVKWRASVGKPYQTYQRPAIAATRMVIVPADLSLIGLERQSGVVLWRVELRDLPESAPACDDWQLAVCEGTTRMRCLFVPDIERLLATGTTGVAAQTKPAGRSVYDGGVSSYEIRRQTLREPARLWDFDDPAGIAMPPVCAHHVDVVFVNREGKLRVVSSLQHQIAGEWQLPAGASAPMTFRLIQRPGEQVASWESWLIVPCQDRAVYAFLLQQGKPAPAWQRVLGDSAHSAPVMLGQEVFVATNQRGLFCLDRDSGQIRWQQFEARKFLSASPRMVLAMDRQGQMLALNRRDGRVLAAVRLDGNVLAIPNSFTDRLYLLDASNHLHCLRDRDPQCAQVQVYHRLLFTPPPQQEKKSDEKPEEKPEGQPGENKQAD